jgi:hypothetical protein
MSFSLSAMWLSYLVNQGLLTRKHYSTPVKGRNWPDLLLNTFSKFKLLLGLFRLKFITVYGFM